MCDLCTSDRVVSHSIYNNHYCSSLGRIYMYVPTDGNKLTLPLERHCTAQQYFNMRGEVKLFSNVPTYTRAALCIKNSVVHCRTPTTITAEISLFR